MDPLPQSHLSTYGFNASLLDWDFTFDTQLFDMQLAVNDFLAASLLTDDEKWTVTPQNLVPTSQTQFLPPNTPQNESLAVHLNDLELLQPIIDHNNDTPAL